MLYYRYFRVNWDRRTKGQSNVIKRKEKPGHQYVSVKLMIIMERKLINQASVNEYIEFKKYTVESLYYASFKLVVSPPRNKDCKIFGLHTSNSSVPL